VDGFTFTAAILSALSCTVLYFYQRFVGLRSGQLALITQSVDSRNHVIVAASVTVGLVASLLQFSLLDTLVGLAVAVLILKSAIELAIETLRSLGEAGVDLSGYKMGLVERYDRLRQTQLRDWMLYIVRSESALTRADLISRAERALDFRGNPALRELGLAEQVRDRERIERSIAELIERGWLVEEGQLCVTNAGKEHLRRQMARTHGEAPAIFNG
jgi:hypothetical protein